MSVWRSPYWGWTLPGVEQDPWWETLAEGMRGADATVRSVQQAAYRQLHGTLVLSVHPSAATGITATSESAAGTWTVLSVAPYGPAENTFTVLNSGVNAVFDIRMTACIQQSATTDPPGSGDNVALAENVGAWRLVVNGAPFSGVASINATTDSAWLMRMVARHARVPLYQTCAVSLGIGAYRCTLETRAVKRLPTGPGSLMVVSSADYVTMLMRERAR